jgi:hypothetical protein
MFDLSIFFQWVIDGFSAILTYLIWLLPNSPFVFVNDNVITPYLGMLNWFIPFQAMFVFLGSWASAVIVFYAIKVILRWAKVIT